LGLCGVRWICGLDVDVDDGVGKEVKTKMGGGKWRESVTNPIPIAGGKKKGGVEYKCCNQLGWFDDFSFFLYL
jgi:hypothetical protein